MTSNPRLREAVERLGQSMRDCGKALSKFGEAYHDAMNARATIQVLRAWNARQSRTEG